MEDQVGSVMVVGGGIAGVQCALDLAESGFKVVLVEKEPAVGGKMAQLDKTFPTNDCSMCILSPKLVEVGRNPMIKLMTLSEVVKVEGEAPDFEVTIRRDPRYVDEEKCVGCGLCAEKCPSKVPSGFDLGLSRRKAIHLAYPQAVPLKYSIDAKNCLYLTKNRCGNCKKVCPAGAVDFEQEQVLERVHVGAIVLAPGYEIFDARLKKEYGYGESRNVITSLELERILSATGPSQGHVVRPSDQAPPQKMAFLQCVGSRDDKVGKPYCSSVCCMHALKQAILAQEHTPGLKTTIFFMDIRAVGKEFEDYRARAEKEHGIRICRGVRAASVEEDPGTKKLTVRYSSGDGVFSEEYDLVVLSVGLEPPADAVSLSEAFGIKLNRYGFADTMVHDPLSTSRRGVFVTGAFSAPKDIPTSVAEASGAASKAGSMVFQKRAHHQAPEVKEIDVSGQEPRIGVFVCDCGTNIRSTVDVPSVVAYSRTMPDVVYAEEGKYTCSADFQEIIKKRIVEHGLNRVVVASCTPRTHELLFQNTIREAGLNPYLFEMANIRDQCSWIHMHEPEKATEKAKDLVRMAVAKSRLLEPLKTSRLEVNHTAVVIGGGLAGMTAALDIAGQGFPVHIIERAIELGGSMRSICLEEDGLPTSEFKDELISKVRLDERISVHLGTEVRDVSGFVGNFKVRLDMGEIVSGAIVVAVGGQEYQPRPGEYMYGDPRVLTQWQLGSKMSNGLMDARSVVMVQCVGSRNEEAPYCSRVCCTEAVRNAIKIKKAAPSTEVFVLHKDIRTYGFREDYYKKAGELGVNFVRFPDEEEPTVESDGAGLSVLVTDRTLGEVLRLRADLVVLSTGIRPNPDNEELSKLLKVPLSKDGFFLEAHMKLRPVDFATEGIFLAGLAHWPKFMDETMGQASGAAARAMTIISREYLETGGPIAAVNKAICNGCGLCEPVCEYKSITIMRDPDHPDMLRAMVNESLCKGCGICVAACPSGAMEQKGFKDNQMYAVIDAATSSGRQRSQRASG